MFRMFIVSVFLLPSLSIAANAFDYSFKLGYTFRNDSVNWNIAGPDDEPNVLSELRWEDLYINQATAELRIITCQNLYFRGYGDYGRIFHGKNRDSDYFGDNRTEEFSRSVNDAGLGEVFDLSAGMGYAFSFYCDKFVFAPIAGGSWHEQHLRMFNGDQVIPDLGPFDNLHSSYKTRWYSAWLGGDLYYQLCSKLTVFGTFEYHWAWFQARGHWNLRKDLLRDFKQSAFGKGLLGYGGVNYSFCGNWGASIVIGYQDWRACDGKHSIVVDVDGVGPEKIETRLNAVNWHSFSSTFFLTYTY